VAKGDRVALVLPNCPQFVITLLGAWKAGAVVAPLNPLYSARELAEALNRLEAKTIVVLTRNYATIKAVQPETPVENVIATNIRRAPRPPRRAGRQGRPALDQDLLLWRRASPR
jgi:long-chain acyl-CoA synthetase